MFLYPYPSACLYLCRFTPENVSDVELRFYFLISHSHEVRTWTKCDSVGWSFMQTHSKQITFSTVIKCCACIFVHERTTNGDKKKESDKKEKDWVPLRDENSWLIAHSPICWWWGLWWGRNRDPFLAMSSSFTAGKKKEKECSHKKCSPCVPDALSAGTWQHVASALIWI